MSGLRIEIRGTVQGVGFRPWVYRIAHELHVAGSVHNHARGVTIEAFATPPVLAALVARLREPPAPARVTKLTSEEIAGDAVEFRIVHSAPGGSRALSIPPDLATCAACEREIFDPTNRRYHYPFTNCTACGPRFTIATGVPYDRPATTMAPFPMCAACQAEYDDPDDRRFHAQPNACPVCGPRLALWTPAGTPIACADPLAELVARLRAGAIAAIKGLGGFHLACDATRGDVITTLRHRKHREQKPFAIMVRDVAGAERYAALTAEERALLSAAERPIVLVERRPDAPLAREIAPGTSLAGIMLPYTPLHHLLLHAFGGPLVMTSANPSEEPICADNAEAVARLGGIADVMLVHDREIATRCDDSVARVIAGHPTVIRRSRGYVPRSITLAHAVERAILAVGAQLKNTFCVATGETAYLGPHVGDLDNPATLDFFERAIARMEDVLRVRPDVIAHDLHPQYLSTQYARARGATHLVGVQHHHAHVASAMAEHGLAGPVIGVAYDGTGWGPDGTAWGGEILHASFDDYARLATFRPVALAGGDAAIREPWRIALALVDDAFDESYPLATLPLFADVEPAVIASLRGMIRTGFRAPRARGIGRFFDGIAALCLARPRAAYEGELAVAWNLAADDDAGRYPFAITDDAIDLRPMVRAIVADLGRAPVATISARFHATLVAATVDRVRAAVARVGPRPVVLTGGAFHNPILVRGICDGLRDLDVRVHGEVPPGDGGIALGQALVADAMLRRHA